MKILIVEDDIDILKLLHTFLTGQGFKVSLAKNYFEAEDKLILYSYDIILLDIGLPDGNGLQLLKFLKSKNIESGVLIVSAKNSLDDKLEGLNLGADDYITKPFDLSELNARINALLRRKNFSGHSKVIFNEISVDTNANTVFVNNNPLTLTKKEYELLLYFIVNKNRMLTKEAIATHLWDDAIDLVDNFDFIYTHIRNLRKKIAELNGSDYVKTVYGMGYKFTDYEV